MYCSAVSYKFLAAILKTSLYIIGMNFVVQLIEKELKPDGLDIVTVIEDNKQKYTKPYGEVAYGERCVTVDREFVKGFIDYYRV